MGPNTSAPTTTLPLHNSASLSPTRAGVSSQTKARQQRRLRFALGGGLVLLLIGIVGASIYHDNTGARYRRALQEQVTNIDYKGLGIDGPIHDIVVAGAGPAGLTAALFGARAGLDVVVLGSENGLLSETQDLDNFPSYLEGNGPDWLKATRQQAQKFGAKFATAGVLATELKREKSIGLYTLSTTSQKSNERTLHAWSVIVATGATPRHLGLPKEELMWGTSLHNCAICDGHLYLDKAVVVVGGGDSAVDAAILLARYAKQVYLVHRRSQLSGKNQAAIGVAQTTTNIKILKPYEVLEWELDSKNRLERVKVRNIESSTVQFFAIDGAFVMIGADPNTEWLAGAVALEDGLVKLGGATKSSVEGVFAVGEVSDKAYKQAITASASGAQAAIDAERWLRETRGVHRHVDIPKMSQQEADHVSNRITRTTNSDTKKGTQSISCDLAHEGCVRELIEKNAVVVFSKSWCPFCRKALEALNAAGVEEPFIVDLSDNEHTREIQATLESLTGRRTVPNVFVGGTSIGGGDETSSLQAAGKLVPLLAEAGALESTKAVGAKSAKGCDLSEQSCVEDMIQEHPVIMFTLSWCPECKRTLELLSSIGAKKPYLVDLDDHDTEVQLKIRTNMMAISGRRSVPNLYIGGVFFGGYAQTLKMHEEGQLIPKLTEAKWMLATNEEASDEEM